MKAIEITGQTFARLTVIGRDWDVVHQVYWKCVCICGVHTSVQSYSLRSGGQKSCGCLRVDFGRNKVIHGARRGYRQSPEYKSWSGMRDRCYNPRATAYQSYGGRGIEVCERWRSSTSFPEFYADMGPCPKGYSLDRYPDNNGPYSPTNCRWASRGEQNRNTRQNVLVQDGCDTLILKDYAARYGVNYRSLHKLITYKGVKPSDAIARLLAHNRNWLRLTPPN